MESLAVEIRVACMSGHVEAGLALYRAGAPGQAAKHLLHPVSEMHQAERAGIDALGFEEQIFKSVSAALEAGKSASDASIEEMLQQADANIALIQKNAGGETNEIITYLMEQVINEYNIGVKAGQITDAGEYLDAFGFALVALKMAKRTAAEEKAVPPLISELNKLVAMWPEGGPLADSVPTSKTEVIAQAVSVMKTLEGN